MNNTSILFWLNRSKNLNNKAPIICRLTINGERGPEISTGKFIETTTDSKGVVHCKRWDYEIEKNGKKILTNDQKVLGSKEDALIINRHLDSIRNKINLIVHEMERKDELISAKKVHAIFTGNDSKKYKLVELYQVYIKRIADLLGNGYEQSTIDAIESKLVNLKSFLKERHSATDLYVHQVDLQFIEDFIHWGKTKRGVYKAEDGRNRKVLPWNHNSAMKQLVYLKKITDECLNKKWIQEDPFLNYVIKFDPPKFKYLTEEEVDAIEKKTLLSDRLNRVKDVFLFCCYTGLEYSAVKDLSQDQLVVNLNGKKVIIRQRKKTEESAYIPLLDKAVLILEKYKDDLECVASGKLLPVKSMQKYNDYLKEIADICVINKKLSSHVARHTAATFLLNNGVGDWTVCQILGLKSISVMRSTYAKLLNKKVDKDMDDLQRRMTASEKLNTSI